MPTRQIGSFCRKRGRGRGRLDGGVIGWWYRCVHNVFLYICNFCDGVGRWMWEMGIFRDGN